MTTAGSPQQRLPEQGSPQLRSWSGRLAVVAGLRVRGLLRLRRAAEEQDKGIGRLVGLALLALAIGGGVAAVCFAGGFFVRLRDAEELRRAAVGVALLGVGSALLLSSLGHAATAYFAAQDLWFWDSSPSPRWSRFLDRATETAVAALPATLVMGGVALLSFLLGAGATFGMLGRVVVTLVFIGMLPLCIGIAVAHLGAAILPAGRLRRLSLVLIGVVTFLFLAWLRSARLEDVVTEEGARRLLEGARSLEDIGAAFWPHNLGSRFILDGEVLPLLGLLGWVGAAWLIAGGLHRWLYVRGRDLAADESPMGLRRGSRGERALFFFVDRLPSDLRPVARKDLLNFVRDATQWSQLLLLLGIAAIYVVNCRALVTGFEGMIMVQEVLLAAIHVGIVTFIAAGLSARFAFPQVGLEGPAVWVVEASPLPARRLLLAKWFAGVPVVAVFPMLVAALGGIVLEMKPILFILSTLTVGAVSAGLLALGTGRGAVAPVLDAVSVSELAMGPGALSTMATAVVLCGGAALGTFLAAGALFFRGDEPLWWLVAALLSWGPAVVIGGVGARALRRGADVFADRKVEGTAGAPVIALQRDAPMTDI